MKDKFLLSIFLIGGIQLLFGQETYSKTYNPNDDYVGGRHLLIDESYLYINAVQGCLDTSLNLVYNCSKHFKISHSGEVAEVIFMDDFAFGGNASSIFLGDNILSSGVDNRYRDELQLLSKDKEFNILSSLIIPKEIEYELIVNRSIYDFNEKLYVINNGRIESNSAVSDQLYVIDKSSLEIDTIIEKPVSQWADNFFDLQEDIDGKIVMLHYSNKPVQPWEELFIIRLDPDDDYSQEVIPLTSTFHASNIKNFLILPNGNYVYTQFKDSSTNVLYCVDRHGNPLWNFEIEGDGFEREVIQELTILDNGDILACGFYTGRYPENPLVTEYDYEVNCGWLMRLSPEGDLIWRHYYPEFYKDDPWPTSRYSYLYDVEEMVDGSIIATGMMSDYDEDGNRYKDDLWLLKVTADGCLEPNDCEDEMQEIKAVSSTEDVIVEELSPYIYPNPASTVIEIDQELIEYDKVLFYNISGSLVKELKVTETIDIIDLKQGLYFLKFVDNSQNEINTTLFINR
jgi:hypothetical protein